MVVYPHYLLVKLIPWIISRYLSERYHSLLLMPYLCEIILKNTLSVVFILWKSSTTLLSVGWSWELENNNTISSAWNWKSTEPMSVFQLIFYKNGSWNDFFRILGWSDLAEADLIKFAPSYKLFSLWLMTKQIFGSLLLGKLEIKKLSLWFDSNFPKSRWIKEGVIP